MPTGRTLSLVVLLSLLDSLLMPGCSNARTKPAAVTSATKAPSGPSQLTVEVEEPLGVARAHWPVTIGVPFPQGHVRDLARLGLSDDTKAATPLQSRVLSRWPDGSVRWALLDWQTDLRPHQQRHFVAGPGAAAGTTVKVSDGADRIAVDTGPLRFAVPKKRFAWLTDVQVNGNPIGAGPIASFVNIDGARTDGEVPLAVTITEAGPLRVRIELRGHYAKGFDYVVRLDAFANQPFVRIFHSFEQHRPEAYTSVRQIGVEVPLQLQGTLKYSAGQEHGAPWSGSLPAQGFTLFQEDSDVLYERGQRRPGRAAGWADLHDATHGVAVAARFFWQEYPQSFQLRPPGLTYNLWAPEAPPAKIGMGTAKTHEMVLYFHGATPPAPALLSALREPLPARLDPRWIVASKALRNALAPSPETDSFLRELGQSYQRCQKSSDTERWDDSGQARCPDAAHERPRRGLYGMFNWGDWNFPGYHDTTKGCDAWGNLEYDMTQVLALAYAATGQPGYFRSMVAAARHFMDVDHVYYQREHPNWIGMNHPKNPLHFSFELGGVDLGHTWTEGLLSYYQLTGDERAFEAVRGIADYLTQRLRTGVVRGNPRQWGWPQIALVAAYETTGNDAYKSAAQEYARGGMSAFPPGKVTDWKVGILAEALAYTHSVTQDTAIRDWLLRYAEAVRARGGSGDPRFFPAVAYVGGITSNDPQRRAASATVSRLKFGNWGKPFTIAGRLGFGILSDTTRPATVQE